MIAHLHPLVPKEALITNVSLLFRWPGHLAILKESADKPDSLAAIPGQKV
jgi:hypothetical protein